MKVDFHVLKLICCKCTINIPLQVGKYNPRVTCSLPQIGNICYRTHSLCFIMHDLGMQSLFIN